MPANLDPKEQRFLMELSHLAPGKSAQDDDLIIRRRHRLVTTLAPPRGGTLLDFGCGNGAQTRLFCDDFDKVIGADIEGSALAEFEEWARNTGRGDKVRGLSYDGRILPVDDASIDYMVSFEVLEHVGDEAQSLDEIARIMRPGGTVAMSVPNRWWVFETHGAELPLLPWNRVPFFSWLPKRLHDRWARARIYRRREIVGKLRAAGLNVQSSHYVTAPMDVVRWAPLQRALRATLFRGDTTPFPMLSTAVLVIAEKP